MKKRLYTPTFLLLQVSNFFFAGSFSMILPELPAYLSSLGGEDFKGLIIALFAGTAAVSRPIAGKLADHIGRRPVMIIGTLVCVVCSALYPLLGSLYGFLFLRLLHGGSTGFKPTAGTAYVADLSPPDRRGEAMGINSVSSNVGFSSMPVFGSWLANTYTIDVMFVVSAVMALVSVLLLLRLPETLPQPKPFRAKLLRLRPREIIEPVALPPAVVTLLVYFPYGVVLTIIPDYADHLGMTNRGLFYTFFTLTSILSRVVAGKASDRYGRLAVIAVAVLATTASLLVIGFAATPAQLLFGGALLGFSMGIAAPATFAWTVDRADDRRRGTAMATVYIALEIGIGAGAMLSAYLYANAAENFSRAFLWTAAWVALAIPYLVWFRWRNSTMMS